MSEYKPTDECKTVEELLASKRRWFGGTRPGGMSRNCWCVDTAIDHVYRGGQRTAASKAFLKAAGLRASGDSYSRSVRIWQWNDAPERTHAEVLAAVRKAGI